MMGGVRCISNIMSHNLFGGQAGDARLIHSAACNYLLIRHDTKCGATAYFGTCVPACTAAPVGGQRSSLGAYIASPSLFTKHLVPKSAAS